MRAQGTLSVTATLRAMVARGNRQFALVELKAADSAYPLFGAVETTPELPLPDILAKRDGAFGAAADPALLARLDLEGRRPRQRRRGDDRDSAPRSKSEPDKLAGGVGFGAAPARSATTALRATGLLQPGSLVRWRYRVRARRPTPSERAAQARRRATRRAQLPDAGWEIRTRGNASPQLERNIERFTQFLTLVGLTALLVGGVGVANAVTAYLDRKRDVDRDAESARRAPADAVFAIYLDAGDAARRHRHRDRARVGAALPFVDRRRVRRDHLPLPIEPACIRASSRSRSPMACSPRSPSRSGRSAARMTCRSRRCFATRSRRSGGCPRAALSSLAAVLVGAAARGSPSRLAYDRKIARSSSPPRPASFSCCAWSPLGLMALARRCRAPRSTVLRLALANIHRPGALTPSVVLSLGLGLALLVTLARSTAICARQFAARAARPGAELLLPRHSRPADADALRRLRCMRRRRARTLERVPMLRGRIVAVNGIAAEELKPRRGRRLGAAERPRHHLRRRRARRLARRRGRLVGAGLSRPAAGLVREEDRRRARPQARRRRSPSTCSAATSRRRSPICARSTGRSSASISCWCFRRTPSAARRTPISRR